LTFALGLLDDGTLLKWGGKPEPDKAEKSIQGDIPDEYDPGEYNQDENDPDLVRIDGKLHLNVM
jgi:hypothetical protein